MPLHDLDDEIRVIADSARLADAASLAATSRQMHRLARAGVERRLARHRASLLGIVVTLGGDAAVKIQDLLDRYQWPSVLLLDDCFISPTGAAAIADALKGNEVLTNLYLPGNNIGGTDYIEASEVEGESKEVGAKVVYQGREMVVIKCVDYAHFDNELKLSDVTYIPAIADALKVNWVLTDLDLSDNKISDVGAAAIAEALRGNGVLKRLDISDNDIGPTGGVAIAEALRGNGVLTSLDVGSNGLTEEAALGIVRVERQRNKLTSLGLARCGVGSTGAAEIAEYVLGSAVLKILNLCDNNIRARPRSPRRYAATR